MSGSAPPKPGEDAESEQRAGVRHRRPQRLLDRRLGLFEIGKKIVGAHRTSFLARPSRAPGRRRRTFTGRYAFDYGPAERTARRWLP